MSKVNIKRYQWMSCIHIRAADSTHTLLALWISAPAFTRHSTITVWPLLEASISGVMPFYGDITQRVRHTDTGHIHTDSGKNICTQINKTKTFSVQHVHFINKDTQPRGRQQPYLSSPMNIRPCLHQVFNNGHLTVPWSPHQRRHAILFWHHAAGESHRHRADTYDIDHETTYMQSNKLNLKQYIML